MWGRSASFILDKNNLSQFPSPYSSSPESSTMDRSNPKPGISAYYQTRAEHHVSSDWLAQAHAALLPEQEEQDLPPSATGSNVKPFSVIDEFNHWRKKPDLAEAVAAIMALAAVIRSSEATTMMELEIELKKASDTLKVGSWLHDLFCQFIKQRSMILLVPTLFRVLLAGLERC